MQAGALRLPCWGYRQTPTVQRFQFAYQPHNQQQTTHTYPLPLRQTEQLLPEQVEKRQSQFTGAASWMRLHGCCRLASSNSSNRKCSPGCFYPCTSVRCFTSTPRRNTPVKEDLQGQDTTLSSSSSSKAQGRMCMQCQEAFEGICIICKICRRHPVTADFRLQRCGAVLPPTYPSDGPVSAFAIFDLTVSRPASFDVNLPVVTARYKQLQQKLHPDKLIDKSPDDRIDDPEILVEVMQIHEQLDACKSREDIDKLTRQAECSHALPFVASSWRDSTVKEIVDELEAQLSSAIMLEPPHLSVMSNTCVKPQFFCATLRAAAARLVLSLQDLSEAKTLIRRLRLYFRVLQRTTDVDMPPPSSSE
ncbi:DnaJ domain-containing protein [Cyclospora cayetanensis]|uniref:DnaJ domain-containing protein n=1 Tax=Cyclospora cayetanensis TaxID=88456 RepID=A0A1D3D0A9_9EIME|nr:DnaJ domain-containing protein [Cyclospora cayetanensis]